MAGLITSLLNRPVRALAEGRHALKIKSFEFNLRELTGATGDFGTFFPLAIGYIAVCGLDPAGFLVMMGLANIVSDWPFRLPMLSGR